MFNKLFGGLLGGGGSHEVQGKALSLLQERKAARRRCDFEVEGWFAKNHYQGTVHDLSASGLCLKLYSPIKVKAGGVITVTYPEPLGRVENLTVDCLVKWARLSPSGEQYIGVEYKDPKALGGSWIKPKMQDAGFRPYNLKEQRKELRVDCNFKATVSLAGTSAPCILQNIGRGGTYVELKKPLRAGATVNLRVLQNDHLPAGTYSATVRHQQHPDPSSPFGYGLAFSELSPEQSAAIEKFVTENALPIWQETTPASPFAEESFEQQDGDNDDEIEIPDLQSILDETEPEEEDSEEETASVESKNGEESEAVDLEDEVPKDEA